MNKPQSPQEFVFPQEAERVWKDMAQPTPRKVSIEMFEDGRYVSPEVVDRWHAAGWQGEPVPRIPDQYMRAFDDLFGQDETSPAQAMRNALVDRTIMAEFENMGDEELMRRCAREVQAMLVVTARNVRARNGPLVRKKPKELGSLIKAVADAMDGIYASYDRILMLRERSMKLVEGPGKDDAPTPETAHDPLAAELAGWKSAARAASPALPHPVE
jgi:hypothetical protein